jgi:hypothetical protein
LTVSFAGFSRDCSPIACFAKFLPQSIKNGQANRQAELAARNDRDARVGWRLQAEIPRRRFDDTVSNRLRVPLMAGGDQTVLPPFDYNPTLTATPVQILPLALDTPNHATPIASCGPLGVPPSRTKLPSGER